MKLQRPLNIKMLYNLAGLKEGNIYTMPMIPQLPLKQLFDTVQEQSLWE